MRILNINAHFCATVHCSEDANVQLPPRHENIDCRVSTAE